MNSNSRFRLTDLVIGICIFILFATAILPAVFCSAGRSREAVCRNNLKLIGVGLELWRQHADKYPFADSPGFGGNNQSLDPWLDALNLRNAYTPENLEAHRRSLQEWGYKPEDFIKTIDDDKIFLCPADHSRPHRINKERANAWGFNPYEYSYALAYSAYAQDFDLRADKQMLSADGVWDWSENLSCFWINDPNASFSTGGWYCNTVGYWHKKNSANLLLRDLHVENHKYPPDTTKVFVWESGESLNVFH